MRMSVGDPCHGNQATSTDMKKNDGKIRDFYGCDGD